MRTPKNILYEPEYCQVLINRAGDNSLFIPLLLMDFNGSLDFSTQIQHINLIIACVDKDRNNIPCIFIGKQPGNNQHFISGIVYETKLLIIDPLGEAHKTEDFIKSLNSTKKYLNCDIYI